VDRVEYYWVDEYDELAVTGAEPTVTKPGVLTFTALPGAGVSYSEWAWYLNGNPIPGETTASYTFDSADKDITKYAVGVMVKKGDKYYYTEITVTVKN
jgi:hypothetical protein